MPQVHWIMSNGDRVSDDVNDGTNLMDAAQMNGIPAWRASAAAACRAPPAMFMWMKPGWRLPADG
jgi:ferredoxin, 2Fe-2S